MIVSCPECGKKLRTSPAAGSRKRIKCPGCSAVFAVAADDVDEDKPSQRAARGTTRRPRRDEDDEAPEPDRAGRGRERDAEEDEYDDDRPARGKRRSRERDFDEDDDRPRSRRKKRTKQGSSALLWVGIGGGAAVLVAAIVVVILLAVRGGSGAYAQHEAAAREVVGLMNELAVALESVQDANTAKQAAPKIISVCDRMQAVHQRTQTLAKITAEENRRLQAKIEADLAPLKARMTQAAFQAGMRSQGEPSFMAAVKRLQSLRNLR